jgi:hypothetical protein
MSNGFQPVVVQGKIAEAHRFPVVPPESVILKKTITHSINGTDIKF